ncbi:MAG: hypothetical protein NT051_02415 [Candidatus Micrarchaeota archaeon]|nr:hypothetical protein [Candidatus Micrarchaeota archaeon]
MSVNIFGSYDNRLITFELFLKAKFPGKKPSEITKEDLLSLTAKNFHNIKLGKSKGQNVLHSLLQDLGYAKTHGIDEDMCKKATRDKIRDARSVFNNLSTRKQVFELFLKAKFNKESSEITKEDLLSLTAKDFQNIKLGKNAPGSSISLFVWYTKTRPKEKNVVYSLFQDLGYAKTHGIEEDMCKQAGRDKSTNARLIFNDLSTCKQVFELFLKAKFPEKKPSEITKEDLLSLTAKDFQNIKLGKNAPGSPTGLLSWYVSHGVHTGRNTLHSIFQDLGYAKTHGIDENMCKKAAKEKIGGHPIFNNLSTRKQVFELFLKAKFNKESSEITKEDLLSLGYNDFRNIKLGKDAPGSPSSLNSWYNRSRPKGQNIIYALLQDLGYSSFFKNEQDYLDARKGFLASNDNGKNLVIISHKNTGAASSSEFEALPDVTSFSICPDTKDVQIILSTTALTNGEAKTNGKPVLDQLAAKIWPGIPMLTERKAYHEMPSIPIGAEVLIHSGQPLDSIYQFALGAMGFEISFLNRQLKTDNMEINRASAQTCLCKPAQSPKGRGKHHRRIFQGGWQVRNT